MAQHDPEQAGDVAAQIVALRDRWHTMKHPFFQLMKDGSLPLHALGVYMANHYHFVARAMGSMGLLYYKAPYDVRETLVGNLAEEHGLLAVTGEAHDHNEMIFAFCGAAGLDREAVLSLKPSPVWVARTLHYSATLREEPVGVSLAMQSTQEGQQVALNRDITIPALTSQYGYAKDAPEIAFFVEHAEADLEHSRRQLGLCEKYLDTPDVQRRALEVCEEAVRLRWASITDIYRHEVLGEQEILPEGIAA